MKFWESVTYWFVNACCLLHYFTFYTFYAIKAVE